jgi:hypothetical protein
MESAAKVREEREIRTTDKPITRAALLTTVTFDFPASAIAKDNEVFAIPVSVCGSKHHDFGRMLNVGEIP